MHISDASFAQAAILQVEVPSVQETGLGQRATNEPLLCDEKGARFSSEHWPEGAYALYAHWL